MTHDQADIKYQGSETSVRPFHIHVPQKQQTYH